MLIAALLAPFVGAFLTYCRGNSIHGSMPKFFDKWLLQVNDEPSWRPQRGLLVAFIGVWPAIVVWALISPFPPFQVMVDIIALTEAIRADVVSRFAWEWMTALDAWATQRPIADRATELTAILAGAGSGLAFTLGHARFQDGGKWGPPPEHKPEDTYLHDVIGMVYTGAAMSVAGAVVLALYSLWVPAALFLIGGSAKALSYVIGWTNVAPRFVGAYWVETRVAEVLQGFFLYACVSAALLIGYGW